MTIEFNVSNPDVVGALSHSCRYETCRDMIYIRKFNVSNPDVVENLLDEPKARKIARDLEC